MDEGFNTERIRAGKIEAKLRLVQYIRKQKRNDCTLNGPRESSAALSWVLTVQFGRTDGLKETAWRRKTQSKGEGDDEPFAV